MRLAADCATDLFSRLAETAARDPDATAVHYKGSTVSFTELLHQSRCIAGGLTRLGIGKGSFVALWMPNCPAWLSTYFALAQLGATGIALNTRFKSGELRDILSRSGATALVYWPGYGGLPFPSILSEALDGLPALTDILVYDEGDLPRLPDAKGRRVSRIDDLAAGVALDEVAGLASDAAVMFTTSGTTNLPKLVLHSQGGIVRHAEDVARAFGFDGPDAMTLQMIPFCGTYGFTQAMAVLLSGKPLVLHPSFDAGEAARLMARYCVDRAGMTYEMVQRTCQALPEAASLGGVTFFVGVRAAEVVPLSLRFGFSVIGIYGSSEVQAFFARRKAGPDPVRMADGGGYPVPTGAELRIRHPETGALLPAGEPGLLEIRTPSLFMEYHNDEDATRAAVTEDGYFRSGDVAVLNTDGSFLYLTRAGEVLRLAGFLVNPAEIEAHIEKYPGILACQVVGVPREGARDDVEVTAFYIPKAGATVGADKLLRHCKTGIAHYKVPQRFIAVSAFPMVHSANTSKIARRELVAMALESRDNPA